MCGHGGHHTCFLCSAQGQGLYLNFNIKKSQLLIDLITRSEYSTMSAWKSTTKTCCSTTQTTDLSQLDILAGSCPILYIRKLITNMITVATMMTKTQGIHATIRYPFDYQVSMQVSGIHANIRYPCKPSENKDKGVKCLEWKQQVAERK